MLEVRTAARLLLLDANRRVLLFRHSDGHGREFWATPGGGVEPGETVEQAARREAAEELGAVKVELAPLWTGHSDFPFANRRVSQTEIETSEEALFPSNLASRVRQHLLDPRRR